MASRARRILLTGLAVSAAALLGLAGWLYLGLTRHAYIADYARLAPAPPGPPPQLRAMFLGVSTILLDDGETAILTDGFFTRPNPKQLFLGKIAPAPEIVSRSLARAGITADMLTYFGLGRSNGDEPRARVMSVVMSARLMLARSRG